MKNFADFLSNKKKVPLCDFLKSVNNYPLSTYNLSITATLNDDFLAVGTQNWLYYLS